MLPLFGMLQVYCIMKDVTVWFSTIMTNVCHESDIYVYKKATLYAVHDYHQQEI